MQLATIPEGSIGSSTFMLHVHRTVTPLQVTLYHTILYMPWQVNSMKEIPRRAEHPRQTTIASAKA